MPPFHCLLWPICASLTLVTIANGKDTLKIDAGRGKNECFSHDSHCTMNVHISCCSHVAIQGDGDRAGEAGCGRGPQHARGQKKQEEIAFLTYGF